MTASASTLPASESAGNLAAAASPTGVIAEWRGFAAFLKRPALPMRDADIDAAGLRAVLRMLALDLLIMAGLLMLAGAATLLGYEFPGNVMNELEWSAPLIVVIVIGAPLMEEIAFRSWLSGRPGHVLACVLVGAGLAIMATDLTQPGDDVNLKALSAFAASLLLAQLALFFFRKRSAMRWFAAVFPLFFWLSTLGFALMHMLNYTEGTLAALLPLVVPQLVIGAMLGYLRVRHGMWANVLLHALHNGTAVGVVLLATAAGGGGA